MKKLIRMLLLIFGMTVSTAMAQNADTVIVIYKNQKSIIPVPAYKSQSSISYSDSNQVIEIGVSQRKPNDISPFPQYLSNNWTNIKPVNKTKWFSQVEAGYVLGVRKPEYFWYYTGYNNGIPYYLKQEYSFNNRNGYQIMLLLHEKEHYLKKKYSLISGFKLGFAQSYIHVNSSMTETDTSGIISTYDNSFQFKVNSVHFIYQFGISYPLEGWKGPARINFGNCLGFSTASIKGIIKEEAILYSMEKFLYITLLQPYLGLEIGKVGVKVSADLNLRFSGYYLHYNNFGPNIAFSLTHRIF